MWINLLLLVPLLISVLQCCIASKKRTKKKKPYSTRNDPKSDARFDRNSRRSDRKIARELNISLKRIQYILKNKLGRKPLKFRKVQELSDGRKKLDWKDPRSYFACTKVASYRICFSPMKSHSYLSSLWTNKIIGFTWQRGQQKICTHDWKPKLKRRPW